MGFFIGALAFFVAMILTLAFTIVLYIHLVIAVKNNRDVPRWMYKMGHALKGRGSDIYKDFTDTSALKEFNFYILGVVIANIVTYFIFYGGYFADLVDFGDFVDKEIAFWLYAEFLIIIGMRFIIRLGDFLLLFLLPAIRKKEYTYEPAASANAVIGMILIAAFACMLTLNLTGLPVKAPVVQVGEYEIVVGQTTGNDLISKGFTFVGESTSTGKSTKNVKALL